MTFHATKDRFGKRPKLTLFTYVINDYVIFEDYLFVCWYTHGSGITFLSNNIKLVKKRLPPQQMNLFI